jgi:hypothetical protein
MCGMDAYNSYLEYAAVFPKIAELLMAAGIKAKVKDNRDKTGLVVQVTLADRTGELNDCRCDNWSITFGGVDTELDIPVENRDANVIVAALLKVIGK